MVKIAKLSFKKLVTKNQSLLHFPRFNRNKRIFAVIFSYSLPLLSKNFARQIIDTITLIGIGNGSAHVISYYGVITMSGKSIEMDPCKLRLCLFPVFA